MTEDAKRIAELEAQVKGLKDNLIHDQLTGLKTRAYFEQELEIYLNAIYHDGKKKRKEGFGYKNIGIIFFDIDHFKEVNDTYGHQVGDKVLKKVSSAIASCFRNIDMVARWGGEEIVASLLGSSAKDVRAKAEEVRAIVEKLDFPDIPNLRVTISAGVTNCNKTSTVEEVIRRVDEAMYQAKKAGRNKVVTYGD